MNGVWQVAERVLYDAYGRARFCLPDWDTNYGPDGLEGTPDDGTVSLFGNTTVFAGREWDAETGLLYYRARYYSPELGRFLARDPLLYNAGDFNLYRYVSNNPLIHADPTGMVKPWNLAACEAYCAKMYNQALKKANKNLESCLDGATKMCTKQLRDDQTALCMKIFYLDAAEAATKYTACGLSCLVPWDVGGGWW